MKRLTTTLAAIALGSGSLAAIAWAATPAQTIAARQGNFKAMGKAFKTIREQIMAPAADPAALRAAGADLAAAAGKVGSHFPKGTGPESGVKTHALPEIWAKPAEFKDRAAKLVEAANAMKGATQSGNVDQIKAAMPALGGACKGCHDQFKERD